MNSKIEEVKKAGKCEGSALKKRDWFILVKGKLLAVQKLALTHEIDTELYYGHDVISEVKARLPFKVQDSFMDEIKVLAKDTENPLDKEGVFNLMISTLDEAATDMTLAMRFEPANKVKSDSDQTKKPDPKPFQSKKKSYTAKPVDGTSQPTKSTAPKKDKDKKKGWAKKVTVSAVYVAPKLTKCKLCDGEHTFLYYCLVFLSAPVIDRVAPGSRSRACFRCLRLDSKIDFKDKEKWQEEHKVNCIDKWVCTEDQCSKRPFEFQYHILMCKHHSEANKQREKDFIAQLDKGEQQTNVKYFFARPIFMSGLPKNVPVLKMIEGYTVKKDVNHLSIFMLQNVKVNEHTMLCFYDSGCMTAGLSNRAAGILGSVCVREGPTEMEVAGGGSVELEHGDERFHLDLVEPNTKATITGLRMDSVTSEFPLWKISDAWTQIVSDYTKQNPDGPDLPLPPDTIGGCEVDLMIGIKYLQYFPQLITHLPSGLGIYRSRIAAPHGRICVLGGPHPAWDHALKATHHMSPFAYFSLEARAWYFQANTLKHVYSPITHESDEEKSDEVQGYGMEAELVGNDEDAADTCEVQHCDKHQDSQNWMIPRNWNLEHTVYSLRETTNRYLEAELSGADITYRCLRCRNCSDCRKGESLEMMSLKEESEQYLIEQSVKFDPEAGKLIAKLPFILEPSEHIKPNRFIAEKIFQSQMRKISSDQQLREGVLGAFEKLASREYVCELSSLPESVQSMIREPPEPAYFIPWRFVHKESSISTPVRLVFDASSTTPGGESLNTCLAKGQNKLTKIHHLLMKFRAGSSAFSADVKMAYNNLALDPSHYRFQLFLWKRDLNPDNPTIVMVVCTLIYGVKPVGNQLDAGMFQIGSYCIEVYPEHKAGAWTIISSAYVDDLLRAANSEAEARAIAESVMFALGLAGMSCKAFTFSGEPPPPEVSSDGKTVGLVGMIWEPEEDLIRLDIKDLFLGKAKRGKLPDPVTGDVKTALSKRFTKRILLGKTAGVFDPLGLLTPVTCKFKLDMQKVTELKTDWDDRLPEDLLLDWVGNLDTIRQLKEVKFRRAVIPKEASSLNVDLIISSDSSQNIAIACIHARVKLISGGYSVQLLTAKSKLVRYKTIPKGELRAAAMGASLGHVAKLNLGDKYGHSIHVTDSTVALHWISQDQRPLETLVRNTVIEIRRFSNPENWYHISTDLNPADLGTRPAMVEEVSFGTEWQDGKPWMYLEYEDMPLKTIQEITLTSENRRLAALDEKHTQLFGVTLPELRSRVTERYEYTQYLHDPNKYGWMRALRVMGYVFKLIRIRIPSWRPVWEPPLPPVGMVRTENDTLMKYAEHYYFWKATLEVKNFSNSKDYKNSCIEKYGILFYTGRILHGQTIDTPVDPFLDIEPLEFVRPLMDRWSPVAYSIMLHVHTYISHHKNVNVTLRESRSIGYVIRGRDLAI